MKKFYVKFLIYIFVLGLSLCTSFYVKAEDAEGFVITPKLTTGEVEHTNRRINFLGSIGGKFWENYMIASENLSFAERWASGILTWEDIPMFLTMVVGFLSQLGLIVGVIFIMYAGYKYMLSVFTGGKTSSRIVKNAIIGVIIVIFSYAIMKTLTSIIGL